MARELLKVYVNKGMLKRGIASPAQAGEVFRFRNLILFSFCEILDNFSSKFFDQVLGNVIKSLLQC